MRPNKSVVIVTAVVSLAAWSCKGPSHHSAPGGAQAAPVATSSGNDLQTTVQYSGVFDEKIHETYTGQQLVKSMTRHLHIAFRESVSLTTPAAALARPVMGTTPVSDSADNRLTFQLSGSVTEVDSPDVAGGQSCSANVSGIDGLSGWSTSTGRPPVEIAVAALGADGTPSKTYALHISAEVPTTGPHGRAIRITPTRAGAGTYCQQTDVLGSRAVQSNPGCIAFAAPGPTDQHFLVLPLDTQDYRKTYSCDRTVPYSSPGVTGTDVVSGGATLTVNAAGAAYVALGDSFSSGDFPPFEDDTCQRSLKAFPELYDSKVAFLACLGRTTAQIAAEQVPDIPANALVISITAGGDDVGLPAVVGGCMIGQLLPGPCKEPADLTQKLTGVQQTLVTMFRKIHDDKAKNAKIYILGYPDPMPLSFTPGKCPALEHVLRDKIPAGDQVALGVANKDMAFFNRLAGRINAAVKAAADAGGAVYVAPDPSFRAHTVCSPDPWFFPLTLQGFSQALHPNEAGHRELEQELFAAAGPAPD